MKSKSDTELNTDDIEAIREAYALGERMCVLARMYGKTESTINNIVNSRKPYKYDRAIKTNYRESRKSASV